MSQVNADKIAPSTGNTLTLGDAGDTITTAGTTSGFGLFSGYAIFCDQKTLGTDGGTFTSGAWRVRDLNTTIANTDASNITLGTNEFTLQAGNYSIKWQAIAGQPNMASHQSGLHDGSSFAFKWVRVCITGQQLVIHVVLLG